MSRLLCRRYISRKVLLLIAAKIVTGFLLGSITSVVGPSIDFIAPRRLRTWLLGLGVSSINIGIIVSRLLSAISPDSAVPHLVISGCLMGGMCIVTTLGCTRLPMLRSARHVPHRTTETRAASFDQPRWHTRLARRIRKLVVWVGNNCLPLTFVLYIYFMFSTSAVSFVSITNSDTVNALVGNRALTNLILGITHIVASIVGFWSPSIAQRIGGLQTLLLSLAGCALGSILMDLSSRIPGMGAVAVITGASMFDVSFSTGLGYIPFTSLPNFFRDPAVRATLSGTLGCLMRILEAGTTYTWFYILNVLERRGRFRTAAFYYLALWLTALTIIALLFLPRSLSTTTTEDSRSWASSIFHTTRQCLRCGWSRLLRQHPEPEGYNLRLELPTSMSPGRGKK